MVDLQLVWVRDSSDGYIQGHISEIGPAEFEVIPIDRKYPKRICSVDDIFPSCDGPQDHDDNCKILKISFSHILFYGYFSVFSIKFSGELLFLNEATFLENLKTRYFKDKIYVS